MGVCLEQWRCSIGSFHKIRIRNAFSSKRESDNRDIKNVAFTLWFNLKESAPIKLTMGLCIILLYCNLIISLLPLFIMAFFSCNMLNIFLSSQFSPGYYHPFSYFLPSFLIVNAIPMIISRKIAMANLFISKLISVEIKNFFFSLFVLQILLVISGSVELNPGPGRTKKNNLSFAIWNLDSIPARDYARIPLIEAFQSTYQFDIFGVCESLLNDSIPNRDIVIDGFSPDPYRADKPNDMRNGGVCLYFKEDLPITQRRDLEKIPETIVAEVKLNRKKIFFVLSYCHPNLPPNEFDEYVK